MTFKDPETGIIYNLDKPLWDYTAGEIYDICTDVTCRTCPFQREIDGCPFYDETPNLWRLEGSILEEDDNGDETDTV